VADKLLSIVYRVTDEASGPLRNIRDASGGSASGLKDLAAAASFSVGAVAAVSKVAFDSAKNWVEYAIAVDDLSVKLGVSNDEAAAMLELSGDLGLNIGTLETAFKNMADEGIEPSLAGLEEAGRLIDAAGTPAERLALATDLFGRAGADLLPFLENMPDDMQAFIDGMSDAKKPTEDMSDLAREMRGNVDTLTDAWDGVTLAAGSWIALNASDELSDLAGIISGQLGYWETLGKRIRTAYEALKDFLGAGDGDNVVSGRAGVGSTVTSTGSGKKTGRAAGGEMTIGGWGGPDSQLVQFMATPGEKVSVTQPGGSTGNEQLVAEVRRLVNTLPTILGDAVARS
jgi:hypothetical protein